MENPEIFYREIYEELNQICLEQKNIDQEKNNIATQYNKSLSLLNEEMDNKTKANRECESRLLAFIDIAKAHCCELIDTNELESYDTGILSRLTVQINNASKNDKFAEQLFMHASNQLRYIRQEVDNMYTWAEQEKRLIDYEFKKNTDKCENRLNLLNEAITTFIYSEKFTNFIDLLKADCSLFEKCDENASLSSQLSYISLGTKQVKLPIPKGYDEKVISVSQGIYDGYSYTVGVPVFLDMKSGSGLLVEYKNENEDSLLNGIQNLILNVLRHCGNVFEQILYVDPVRYNNSSLGVLQPLSSGGNSVIDSVPLSVDEARKKLNVLISHINADERRIMNTGNGVMPKRLLIFHNFPHAYDSTMISQVQQLFANASHYNISIIVTNNLSAKNSLSSDSVELIRTMSTCIRCKETEFYINDMGGDVKFKWYIAPNTLPSNIRKKYVDEKPVLDTSNDYDRRIGIDQEIDYRKGIRCLDNIPYGVDEKGNLRTIDFENSNFATFICGASRSGKSTLLHTIITGLVKNNHPDDIELWLIDFKMTEFSRYIDHLPPHVRYIILDESPELVYDIIDRLTEILTKRQNVFKGKWQKLNEVPSEKYMPAILVIIDEFSVMSQIVADSLLSSKENYSAKLQALLAKGAALGLHFIFASQGFTSGTRGLNDFSKKQIQQRIAMKTEYNEIKETLDLKTASDDDRTMMEQLPIHHALVRTTVDDRGNHLKQLEILYISDYSKQEVLIKKINDELHVAPRYDVNDISIYIDKKSMVVDGNNYSTFNSKRNDMQEYINKRRDLYDEEVMLFLGEPRRMMPIFPVAINNGFCENLLVVSPISEKMATTSVIMSIAQSLQFVDKVIDIWTTKKNEIYRQIISESQQKVGIISKELDEVCQEIKRLKELIENKIEGSKYIVILGTETLLLDMSYQGSDDYGFGLKNGDKSSVSTTIVEKRAPGEMDLNSLLDAINGGHKIGVHDSEMNGTGNESTANEILNNALDKMDKSYDARNDLKFILTQGPRLGYHFILVFNTAGELNQSKVDLSLFKHKILFRLPKADAVGIIGATGASVVAEMDAHSFRYTNGIETLSFRPYLHAGLSWDGWVMRGNDVTNMVDAEEEYLM